MKLFRVLRDKYQQAGDFFRQLKLDKHNHELFIKTINEECNDRKSEFVTKYNLRLGDDGESLVLVTKIPVEFQTSGHDYMIADKLNENTYFITEFLKMKAGFFDYITLPEYYHVEDPASNEVSLTYLAVWRFNPMLTKEYIKKVCMKIAGWSILAVVAIASALIVVL